MDVERGRFAPRRGGDRGPAQAKFDDPKCFSQVGLTQLRSAAHAFSTYALDLHTVNLTSVHGSSGANCVL